MYYVNNSAHKDGRRRMFVSEWEDGGALGSMF